LQVCKLEAAGQTQLKAFGPPSAISLLHEQLLAGEQPLQHGFQFAQGRWAQAGCNNVARIKRIAHVLHVHSGIGITDLPCAHFLLVSGVDCAPQHPGKMSA
jgi:hypothetical protein